MSESVTEAPTRAERMYGVVGGGAVLVALFLLVRSLFGGGAKDDGAVPPGTLFPLTIVAPAAEAAVEQPVSVTFVTRAPLKLDATGWAAEGRHLHLTVGGSELMPGPRDVVPAGTNRWTWTLPRLPAGAHEVVLLWSGPDHRPIAEGASAPVRVTVR